MTAAGSIAKTLPTLQSIALLKDNLKELKKKKKKKNGIVKQGVKNIIGLNLLKVNAQIAGTID